MLKFCIFVVLLWVSTCLVDTSVRTSLSYVAQDSEVQLELTREYQWGKHLVRNIPLQTTIASEVYFFGGEVELSFKKITIDDSCHVSKCQSCNGTKAFEKEHATHGLKSMHIHKSISYPCPRCLGLGITVDAGQRCQPYISSHITRKYFITAGLFMKEIATLPKEGNEIFENGDRTTGSLLVSIQNIYSDKDNIRIEGHCVHMVVNLTPEEALYGFTRQLNLTQYFQTASVALLDEGDTKVDVTKDAVNGTMLLIDRTNLATVMPLELTLKSFVVFPINPNTTDGNSTSVPLTVSKTQDLIIELQLHTVEYMQHLFLDQFGCIRATAVASLCPPLGAIDDVISLDGTAAHAQPVMSECELSLYQQYVYNVTVRGEEVLLCQKEVSKSEKTFTDANPMYNKLLNEQDIGSSSTESPDWFDVEYALGIGKRWNELTAKDQLIRRMLYIIKSKQNNK